MVIPKFCFFQVEVKGLQGHASEFGHADFGYVPGPLDSVNVRAVFFSELVFAVIDALMAISDVDQPIIASLGV